MAVKDGLPSTDFSRMNREYIKAVTGESGGIGLPAVTEADNGKILGVVNGAWGAMDAGGGGNSDFTEKTLSLVATNTDEQHYTYYGYGIFGGIDTFTGEVNALVESNDKWCLAEYVYSGDPPGQITAGTHTINLLMTSDGELQFWSYSGKVLSISGDIELVQDPDNGDYYLVTGDCTINVDLNPD